VVYGLGNKTSILGEWQFLEGEKVLCFVICNYSVHEVYGNLQSRYLFSFEYYFVYLGSWLSVLFGRFGVSDRGIV
jgi:hypothetical protein